MRWKTTFALAVLSAVALQTPAKAEECTVNRFEVLSLLEEGVSGEELGLKIDGCVADDGRSESGAFASIGQSIEDTGSTFYEELTGCGYHPQRKELTCPIAINQPFGFGGAPALQPVGSYEYVLFCVNYGAGLVPVNINGVHVHDEAFGANPNWYMSAVVPANAVLFSQPLLGQTLRARAILSWAVPPAGCNAVPVWGNQADFRIRLDP